MQLTNSTRPEKWRWALGYAEVWRAKTFDPVAEIARIQGEDEMTELINLGSDVGMGAIKLYGARGGSQTLSQVAVNGTQRVTHMAGLSLRQPPLRIEQHGQSYYVDLGAHDWGRPLEAHDYERLNGTPEMRALLCGALTRHIEKYGVFEQPLCLTVGMPIETLSGDAAQVNVAAISRWLKGEQVWLADGKEMRVQIAEVKVTSQAAGALFDYLLDETGQFIPARKSKFKSEIGIVSVGFNTIELLLVRDRAPVQRFTAGATVGVRRLLELVNTEKLYSLGELDTQLRSGRLDVSQAIPIWEREIAGVIENRWGTSWRRFAAVLVVGGGAMLLRNSLPLQFNGKAIVPDDPVQSIARGLFKLAQFQANRRKA
jgi:hypothetical protein